MIEKLKFKSQQKENIHITTPTSFKTQLKYRSKMIHI